MTLQHPKPLPPRGRKSTFVCIKCLRILPTPVQNRGPKKKLCDECVAKNNQASRKKTYQKRLQERKLIKNLGFTNFKAKEASTN